MEKQELSDQDKRLAALQVDAFLNQVAHRLGVLPSDLPDMARGAIDFYKSARRVREYRRDFIQSAVKALGYAAVIGAGYVFLYGFKLMQKMPVPIPVP